MDTTARSGVVFLCISESHQGKVQLAVDSVHLIAISTATICIHFKQTDGTYLENICTLPNCVTYLWRCSDLRDCDGACVAYLGIAVQCLLYIDNLTQVMVCIVGVMYDT